MKGAQLVTFEFGGFLDLFPWQFPVDDNKTSHVNNRSAKSVQKKGTSLVRNGEEEVAVY